MVLWFSGTLNSYYVAKRIADALSDTLVSLNDRIKNGDCSGLHDDERYIIVTPTYAWRIPHAVEQHIMKTNFGGTSSVWFVMTCGGESGNADHYLKKLCAKKKFSYMGLAEIVMPENYIAMFSAPDNERAKQIVSNAQNDINFAIEKIKNKKTLDKISISLYDRLMSGPVNPLFYALCVKAKAFYTKESCTGCGKCAKLCPMNNITIENGRPVWGSNCTHCMACICRCPSKAVEYGKKSENQPRYVCDSSVTGQ